MKTIHELANGLSILGKYSNPAVAAGHRTVAVSIDGGVHYKDASQLEELGWERDHAISGWKKEFGDE